jgi:thiol-disulfide isomerase/thioredoxin
VAVLAVLAGCTSTQGTGDKGYVTGDGVVREVAPDDRGDPIELSGETLDGEQLDLADLRGKPVVVTVWGSWCPPCRAEAPWLVAAAEDYDGRVAFVGINNRDASTDNANAFVRTFDVPFPSFFSPGGEALLRFPGVLGPNTIPSTVVLDDEGRVAASIVGPLPSEGTLPTLVDEVLADG